MTPNFKFITSLEVIIGEWTQGILNISETLCVNIASMPPHGFTMSSVEKYFP